MVLKISIGFSRFWQFWADLLVNCKIFFAFLFLLSAFGLLQQAGLGTFKRCFCWTLGAPFSRPTQQQSFSMVSGTSQMDLKRVGAAQAQPQWESFRHFLQHRHIFCSYQNQFSSPCYSSKPLSPAWVARGTKVNSFQKRSDALSECLSNVMSKLRLLLECCRLICGLGKGLSSCGKRRTSWEITVDVFVAI